MRSYDLEKFRFDDHLDYARAVVANHGPDEDEYAFHMAWYDVLNSEIQTGVLGDDRQDQLRSLFGESYSARTLQGHAFQKPFGYAGDYVLIEKIYANHVSPDPEFEKYDRFFQSQEAATAVRYRKQYFKELVWRKASGANTPLRILNLACGPCREVLEFLDDNPTLEIYIHCVDFDERALAYAETLLREHQSRVTFEKKNILKFKPEERYSLVWSSGLFDYFSDRMFARILARMLPALSIGGELVVGNFGIDNASRGSMEALANWYLHHRTDEQLVSIAREAGAEERTFKTTVGRELTGINRFLHVRRSVQHVRWDLPQDQLRPKWVVTREATATSEEDGI